MKYKNKKSFFKKKLFVTPLGLSSNIFMEDLLKCNALNPILK